MVSDALRQGRIDEAKTQRWRLEDLFRLLDDLGWEEEAGPQQDHLLTMSIDQSERTLRDLRDEAERALDDLGPQFVLSRDWAGSKEEEDESVAAIHGVADHFLDLRSTCDEVLDALNASEEHT